MNFKFNIHPCSNFWQKRFRVGILVCYYNLSSLTRHIYNFVVPGRLLGGAVAGHTLAVSRELEGEVLLPLGLHVLAHDLRGLEASSTL